MTVGGALATVVATPPNAAIPATPAAVQGAGRAFSPEISCYGRFWALSLDDTEDEADGATPESPSRLYGDGSPSSCRSSSRANKRIRKRMLQRQAAVAWMDTPSPEVSPDVAVRVCRLPSSKAPPVLSPSDISKKILIQRSGLRFSGERLG